MRNSEKFSQHLQKSCQKIWQMYKHSRATDYILRTGFRRYNIYTDIDSLTKVMSDQGLTSQQIAALRTELAKLGVENTNRPDSVSEHCHGASELAIGISRFFPERISGTELKDCLVLLHYHDLAETVIGDIPDNGSEAHLNKHTQELKIMEDLTSECEWPASERYTFLGYYRVFQFPKDIKTTQALNAEIAKIAYFCDKLDAVLKALIYESYGHTGFIDKKEEPTELDQMVAEAVGTSNIVDCWAYRFYDVIKDYEYGIIFKEILNAALIDVRGQVFSWL